MLSVVSVQSKVVTRQLGQQEPTNVVQPSATLEVSDDSLLDTVAVAWCALFPTAHVLAALNLPHGTSLSETWAVGSVFPSWCSPPRRVTRTQRGVTRNSARRECHAGMHLPRDGLKGFVPARVAAVLWPSKRKSVFLFPHGR